MAYTGYDIVAFDRITSTTIAEHMTEVEEAHLRNYAFPAQLQAAGRITFNHGGRGFDWPVQYRRHNVKATTGANARTFAPLNLWKTASLPWRGYEVTDSISRIEIQENKGPQAIVPLLDGFKDRLTTSIDQGLARQYFNDNNTNSEWWHGMETMFGTNGTITSTTGAQRATNQADIVAYPSATYAGISTELSAYGGVQIDGIWPAGDVDPQREFWSPLIFIGDSSNSIYTSTVADSWVENCEELLGLAISHQARIGGLNAQPTTGLFDRVMFNAIKSKLRKKETIFRETGSDPASLQAIGFKNVIVVDGLECTSDNSMASGVGYLYSYRNIELRCMEGQLLTTEGPEYDIDTQSHKCVVSTLSNLKFSTPRNFVKIVESRTQIT